jgi:hypothetical protein
MENPVIPVSRFRPKHFVLPDPDPEAKYRKGEKYSCTNTRTNESVMAEFTGEMFSYPWEKLPDSFCLTNFDVPVHKLKAALELNFPALRNVGNMRFLIMKEI